MLRSILEIFFYKPDTRIGWFLLLLKWLVLLGLLLAPYTIVTVARGTERLALIKRYLRRKLAPIFAVAAVTLCTAMVIVVISIMGGFLDLMRSTARALEPDVTIAADVSGIPYYQEIIDQLNQQSEIAAASPIIQSYGLLKLANGDVQPVEIFGINPDTYNKVADYRKNLHWSTKDYLQAQDEKYTAGPSRDPSETVDQFIRKRAAYETDRPLMADTDIKDNAMSLTAPNPSVAKNNTPGIVTGMHVNRDNRRDSKGNYQPDPLVLGQDATLTVFSVTPTGRPEQPQYLRALVINEMKSGYYEVDKARVYVPFDILQKLRWMHEYPKYKPDGTPTGETHPAHASSIAVRGKPGVPLEEVSAAVNRTLDTFAKKINRTRVYAETWEESKATFLQAVEKEKVLITLLFGVVSIVAIAMIAVIFYMIVLEKTRDIGVLRAIGASRSSIMAVFLGYGLSIGLLGAFLGFCTAAAIVWNINQIQDYLNKFFGITVWTPDIYYFDKIPNHMHPGEVTFILIVVVLASLLGSLIPAFLAARLNPIEALRYE